jgi:predicted TIM-barrel fold metal-dependent hydrolase
MPWNRRHFIVGATAALGSAVIASPSVLSAAPDDIPIVDCHIHLFDATRPQGAPYRGGRGFSGGVALPDIYTKIAKPLGIVAAIEVEASPWIEDNLWVLEAIQPSPFMVGTVGNLQPERPEFAEYLGRYAKNPLFRGIRYGNLWGYDLVGQVDNPVFIDGLKLLAQHDMVLETANQNIPLLQAAVKASDRIPELRIILDHLPALDPDPGSRADYEAAMREISGRRNIWAKLSEIVHPVRTGQRARPRDASAPDSARSRPIIVRGLAAHRERLDMLMSYMGEDRVLFGSDWPNCVGVSEVPDTVALVRDYFSAKSRDAAEKYLWKNSVAAYKWVRRAPDQPALS